LTEQATETAERLTAELAALGEVKGRKMFGGYGVYAGMARVRRPVGAGDHGARDRARRQGLSRPARDR
jgi:hypothetical protein